MVLKEACQLLKAITADDLDVLELLRGVHSKELKKELLKVQNSKPSELVLIVHNWQHGKEMDKLFQATAQIAKATSRTRTRHNRKRPKMLQMPRPRTSLKGAWGVVNLGKIQMNLKNTRPVVWQKKRSVQGVNAKELPPPIASAKGNDLSGNQRRPTYRVRVPIDNQPTPNMENVRLKTKHLGFRPQVHSAYPNRGAEQSMVSEDLIEILGLKIENSTKAVEAVYGGCVTCFSSSPVEVK